MFGADTALVFDALQVAGVALAIGAVGTFLMLRKSKAVTSADHPEAKGPEDLEDRVRVLERIATDQSIGLADEIEALRETAATSKQAEVSNQ